MEDPVLDAYDGIRLDLPGGRRITCRPLKLKESLRYHRLLIEARMGDPHAQIQILDEFPTAVGIQNEELTTAEVFEVLDRFLSYVRTPLRRVTAREQESPTTQACVTTGLT